MHLTQIHIFILLKMCYNIFMSQYPGFGQSYFYIFKNMLSYFDVSVSRLWTKSEVSSYWVFNVLYGYFSINDAINKKCFYEIY